MDGRSLSSALVRNLRKDLGLTQRDLARRAGVPQPTISAIESGSREPSLSLLTRITEAAGLALDVRLLPVEAHSALATANTIRERLTGRAGGPLPLSIRQDGALRSVLDLKDALRRSDRGGFQTLVAQPPSLIGDRRWDAIVAAVVEDEAAFRDIAPPRWTSDPRRFTKPFWYLSENSRLHAWERSSAPAAFVRHGVLAAREELESV